MDLYKLSSMATAVNFEVGLSYRVPAPVEASIDAHRSVSSSILRNVHAGFK